ncbi:MAG: 1-(5-phosphoribosyl)-5-[(5-phosphoribosylamino)methylideneamino]imidazole-4-carboxamide isomerase [Thermoproteota archaeon]|nr:1-(5-phosphoribosyl)-5-[(5-phosphoribosylamino)methylideneamino]imidazole-4-carboxamide isomerase [Thermoproteota archaeon]
MKILAAIDIMDGKVVRLTKGQESNKIVYGDDPLYFAKKWTDEGADMLHVVDLDAALHTGGSNTVLIEEIVRSINIPIQVAGGLRSEETIEKMFDIGASRVVLGTLAYKKPTIVRKMVKLHPQEIVISIDEIGGLVMVKGWKSSSGYSVIDAIGKFVKIRVSRFLLTSIDKDGTLEGPDIEMLNKICTNTEIKITASGGISTLKDVVRAAAVGCNEVILGKALYEERVELKKARAIT